MLRTQLDTAYQSDPDAIGIISWNEFSENSHVEPSCLYGFESLDVIADLLGGSVPEPIPCGVGTRNGGRNNAGRVPGCLRFSVEEAESTIAIVQEGASIPGASSINIDTSDTTQISTEPRSCACQRWCSSS